MATKTVESQRVALEAKDATRLQDLMATLDEHRTHYGQHQFNLDYLRAQYEDAVRQTVEAGDTLRTSIQESQGLVQTYSQELLEKYKIDTSLGGWSLETADGAFIQYREEEVKKKRKRASKAKAPSKRRAPPKRGRRAAKKTTAK